MSTREAVLKLFVAFGAQRNADQARLYAEELDRSASCGDCAEVAVERLTRESRRLPSLSQVLDAYREAVASEAHTPHIVNPQLAPRAETWWRSEAVKLLLPAAGNDRNIAAFVAASMWYAKVEPTFEAVSEEARHPLWFNTARTFLKGGDEAGKVARCYFRSRWDVEHPGEPMPVAVVNMEVDGTDVAVVITV